MGPGLPPLPTKKTSFREHRWCLSWKLPFIVDKTSFFLQFKCKKKHGPSKTTISARIFPVNTSISVGFSHDFPAFSQWFSHIFPWFSRIFPMIFPWPGVVDHLQSAHGRLHEGGAVGPDGHRGGLRGDLRLGQGGGASAWRHMAPVASKPRGSHGKWWFSLAVDWWLRNGDWKMVMLMVSSWDSMGW